jgi:aryl-alcohol dehydrogenase-like predicted oxidoreductase
LRQAALEHSLSHPVVSTALIGCRTATEVDQMLDAHLLPDLSNEFWDEFNREFEADVAAFPSSGHWFYDKVLSDIGQ